MISNFLFIGHRGTRINVDENTILAFSKALEYGANCVELDVRKTKDGKLVVLHDSAIDRTTNGSGLLNDYTLTEIRKFKTKIQHSEIPLLTEVLDALKGKIKFMIDLKETNLLEDLSKFIRKNDILEECIISGRILTDLLEFKRIYPQSKICYNITKGQGLSFNNFMNLGTNEIIRLNFDLISLHSSSVSQEFIELCHKNDIKSLSWDFLNYDNPLQKIQSMINLGIDGILFDNHNYIPQIKRWRNRL
ncbi:MAG: hypothetical protein KGD58_01425 [Candidatus Lokiarchaeota archaeon]|nr:hypothetical protein [Candidatus Lokiarchaeota archaeon]